MVDYEVNREAFVHFVKGINLVSYNEALVLIDPTRFRTLMPDSSNSFLGDIILNACEFEQYSDVESYTLGIDPKAMLEAIGRMRQSETLYLGVGPDVTKISTPNGKSIAKLTNIDKNVIRTFPENYYEKSDTKFREGAGFHAIVTGELLDILKAYKNQDKVNVSYKKNILVFEGGDFMSDGYEWREELLPPDIVVIDIKGEEGTSTYTMDFVKDILPMLSLCNTGYHLYTGDEYLLGLGGAYASMDSTFTYWLTPRI